MQKLVLGRRWGDREEGETVAHVELTGCDSLKQLAALIRDNYIVEVIGEQESESGAVAVDAPAEDAATTTEDTTLEG